jgi:hypothetical protein
MTKKLALTIKIWTTTLYYCKICKVTYDSKNQIKPACVQGLKQVPPYKKGEKVRIKILDEGNPNTVLIAVITGPSEYTHDYWIKYRYLDGELKGMYENNPQWMFQKWVDKATEHDKRNLS